MSGRTGCLLLKGMSSEIKCKKHSKCTEKKMAKKSRQNHEGEKKRISEDLTGDLI